MQNKRVFKNKMKELKIKMIENKKKISLLSSSYTELEKKINEDEIYVTHISIEIY